MRKLDVESLINACSDQSEEAGIRITSSLRPTGGPGAPVKPATYQGGHFQVDKRWWGADADRRVVDVLVIDNEPSQANRLEAALEADAQERGLPQIVLDLSSAASLPPHLPKQISSFRFPHRNADAYLRDSVLDGEKFPATIVGKAIFDATADHPEALFQWLPQALLYGFWQSHLGKKRSQAKLARSWSSEILGVEPAAMDVKKLGSKGDDLNLNISETVIFDTNDTLSDGWSLAPKGGKKLSEIGHGQVTFPGPDRPPAPAGVSFREIVQQSTVSFASLRRVQPGLGAAEGRALLVAIGLMAHVEAFGRPFSLRSGAELSPVAGEGVGWEWLGADRDEPLEKLNRASSRQLFDESVTRAEAAGLPVGSRWGPPLVVEPGAPLLEVIKSSWPVA